VPAGYVVTLARLGSLAARRLRRTGSGVGKARPAARGVE
jgi:hypothetical protein